MGILNHLAIRMNYWIRNHPSRWLYSDRFLSGYMDNHEIEYFTRDWGDGVIWDVGASIGKYTTILAKSSPRAKIFAFEPNLNSLYYLGYRTANYGNVVIVPTALTVDGGLLKGSYDPNFSAPSTGPMLATISLREAIQKSGVPKFIKMDIEGGEFPIFESAECQLLQQSTILVSWHPQLVNKPIPQVKGWKNTQLPDGLALLEPM